MLSRFVGGVNTTSVECNITVLNKIFKNVIPSEPTLLSIRIFHTGRVL